MDVTIPELLEESGLSILPERPEGFGITIREFMRISKIPLTYDKARDLLEKAAESGILIKTMMSTHGPGGSCSVYSKPGGKEHVRKEESKR